MSEAKFTPGPWRVTITYDADQADERWYGIAAGKREGPFQQEGHFHPEEAIYYTDEIDIVPVSIDPDWGTPKDGIANKADAQLIAAAPDLYDALAAIERSMKQGREVPEWLRERMIVGSAALAKARGVKS